MFPDARPLFLLTLVSVLMATHAMGETAQPSLLNLSPLSSGTEASLRGIAACDAKTVWISGTGGTVRRSANGGESWENVAPDGTEELDFRDLQCLGGGHLLAMSVGPGESSRIYKTKDHGKTWRLVLQNKQEAAFFNGLALWDNENGLLTSDPIDGKPYLFKTEDGGESWQRVGQNLPALKDGEYGFAASGTLITVAAGGHAWLVTGGAVARIFHSANGGVDWEVYDTPIRDGASSAGIFSAAFRDDKRGVIVGGDYQKPELSEKNVAWTADGGKSWKLAETDKEGMPQKACVQHLGDGHYLAAGRTGLALSTDDGYRWQTVSKESYYTMAWDEASGVGYLAGADGRVARFQQAQE